MHEPTVQPASDPSRKRVDFADLARRVRELRSQGQTPNIGEILQTAETTSKVAPIPARRTPMRPPARPIPAAIAAPPEIAAPPAAEPPSPYLQELRRELAQHGSALEEMRKKNEQLLDELGRAKIHAKESGEYRIALGDALEREQELVARLEKTATDAAAAEGLRVRLAEMTGALAEAAARERTLGARLADLELELSAAGEFRERLETQHAEALARLRAETSALAAALATERSAAAAETDQLRLELEGRETALAESSRRERAAAVERDSAKNEATRLLKIQEDLAEQYEAVLADMQLAHESLVASHLKENRGSGLRH